MSKITIETNNVPRSTLYWHELTDKERGEFDYLDTEERQSDAVFVRYCGVTYDIGEFSSLSVTGTPEFKGWNAYYSDSYFSGVLMKWAGRDYDSVIMATFYS